MTLTIRRFSLVFTQCGLKHQNPRFNLAFVFSIMEFSVHVRKREDIGVFITAPSATRFKNERKGRTLKQEGLLLTVCGFDISSLETQVYRLILCFLSLILLLCLSYVLFNVKEILDSTHYNFVRRAIKRLIFSKCFWGVGQHVCV